MAHQQLWKRGRVAYGVSLENWRSERAREFESHRFRQIRKVEVLGTKQLGKLFHLAIGDSSILLFSSKWIDIYS